ncbi:DUF5131 family protein [Thalassospira xianhensis]|uniref:DUF5131 family protein n=1 Tax=Thalassospira xianhensis TaxID=478503 RepID=UPI000DEE1352|nr:DUF5131 family protein [Thalassospira xianhensis]
MSDKTGISWTDATWNPVAGCTIISPGCRKCYAMKMAARLERMGSPKYTGLTKQVNGREVWTGEVRTSDDKTISWPLKAKRPRRIFTNSMSDLGHEGIPVETQMRIIDVMAQANWHTFQVLTKRPVILLSAVQEWLKRQERSQLPDHIWWGVSAENQQYADERIPILSEFPAKVRFASMEPLLERVDLADLPPLEWYIVGGESVERTEPSDAAAQFDPDWARDILTYAQSHNARFHLKQLGSNPVGGKSPSFKGQDMDDFPPDLRVQEWPAH